MTTYMIFTREKTTNQAELDKYGPMAGAASGGHKLTPLVVYGKHEVLEGAPTEGVVILSRASPAAASSACSRSIV